MKNLFIILFLLSFSLSFSQTKTDAFFVDGVCGMCKERIENSCIKVKGIKMVNWNLENREIKVIYNTKKISIDEIHKFIASIGHDTKKEKAPEEIYNSLDMCCKYRDEQVVKDHQ
jgi:copper chaperone CopZ